MTKINKPLFALTADDLMTGDLLLIRDDTPLRTAAHMLLRHHVSGAPVVDPAGKLVGVISTTDFMRSANMIDFDDRRLIEDLEGCVFQTETRDASGNVLVMCELPAGVCSVQRILKDASGNERIVCGEPHEVFADWQIAILDSVPMDSVRKFMTQDTVTAELAAPIRVLARKMVDAGIHRIVIVDGDQTPLGIVSSTDILAAVARAAPPLVGSDDKENAQALRTTPK
jgi:CBS-domain-containing membrane protein